MKLHKVISGGQTGADQTGVEEAAKRGYDTGGTTTKGHRTDEGPNPDWCAKYGLVESYSADFPPRTRKNVEDSNVTVWFGNTNSPGFYCTKKGCKDWGRPMVINPTPEEFKATCSLYEVVNIAGNRKRTNPPVVQLVVDAFSLIPEKTNG